MTENNWIDGGSAATKAEPQWVEWPSTDHMDAPVPGASTVEVRFRNADTDTAEADTYRWDSTNESDDIVAYRVLELVVDEAWIPHVQKVQPIPDNFYIRVHTKKGDGDVRYASNFRWSTGSYDDITEYQVLRQRDDS